MADAPHGSSLAAIEHLNRLLLTETVLSWMEVSGSRNPVFCRGVSSARDDHKGKQDIRCPHWHSLLVQKSMPSVVDNQQMIFAVVFLKKITDF